MSSSASPAPSRRKTLLSLGVLALLTGIVVFIFREHWAEISEALSRLTLGQGLLALAVGLSYPLLEGVSSWLIVRSRLPHFPLRQGIDNAWMGHLRQCGGPRRRVGAVSDVVSPPARAGRRPRRRADDPAIRLPQDSRPALRHRAASGRPPLDGGPLRRRAAVSARGLRCRGGRHRGAHRPLRPAGGAASGPVAAAFSARHRPLGRAPGKLAGAAGHPEHREPPSAGGQAPLCRHSGRASRQAVPALLPAVDGAAVHGAGYRTAPSGRCSS